MRRWSLRARIAAAVTVTVAVAFLAGAALLVWLSSVEDDAPVVGDRVVAQLEERGLVEPLTRQGVVGLTRSDGGGRDVLQVLARRRLLLSALLATTVAGPLGWVLVGRALQPLARLREGTSTVAETTDLSRRVPVGEGPEEVDALARTVNAMLARLQEADLATRSALDASRAFAAGAAHELRTPLTALRADVDALASPALAASERDQVLAEMGGEHARLAVLLDQLLALSRGDLGTDADWEEVDLGDVVEVAAASARRRWPAARVETEVLGEGTVAGSAEGLRLLVDNLLANAVVHGASEVRATLVAGPGPSGAPAVTLAVDDDGPGIPAEDRQRVLGRFQRGRGTTAPGSGLGLALVDQQVSRHHGTLAMVDSSLGGLRIEVCLPAVEGAG